MAELADAVGEARAGARVVGVAVDHDHAPMSRVSERNWARRLD